MEEIYRCYNKGCGQDFTLKDNSEKACTYHPGGPIFHDALKGWSCCKKRVSDFTEFLNLKGCTVGWHSNVKPKEPEKQEKKVSCKLEITPEHRKPDAKPAERPPDDEDLVELKKTIGASLKTQLEKLNISEESTVASKNGKHSSISTACLFLGICHLFGGPMYIACTYHPGGPIFHDALKGWSCCKKRVSDFTEFL
ncbi:hypothetical protein EGW08_008292, partial [Elysia chlorotica]